MPANHSPWIDELRRGQVVGSLGGDEETDVVVIGAGIAGISTAYFLLAKTDLRVTVLEADLIAHGATGHNAGQVTSQFEFGIPALEREFGTELCASTVQDLQRGWGLLEAMRADAAPDVPCPRFKGAVAVTTKEQALGELEDMAAHARMGVPMASMALAEDWHEAAAVKAMYPDLVRFVPAADVMRALETQDPAYRGYATYDRAVANSALLSTRVAETLLARYPERLVIHEQTRVADIALDREGAYVRGYRGTVRAKRVVLCTNGFAGFDVHDADDPALDPAREHPVEGVVGYMAGYYERAGRPPLAVSYMGEWEKDGDPYFYVTRRPYASPHGHRDLVCVGGPHAHQDAGAPYARANECPDVILKDVGGFVRKTFGLTNVPAFAFCWHGLMGYTDNGARLIGAEPRNPVLLYNLGCNGIGLLPSVYGAERVARIVGGEEVAPTFFDPRATPPLSS